MEESKGTNASTWTVTTQDCDSQSELACVQDKERNLILLAAGGKWGQAACKLMAEAIPKTRMSVADAVSTLEAAFWSTDAKLCAKQKAASKWQEMVSMCVIWSCATTQRCIIAVCGDQLHMSVGTSDNKLGSRSLGELSQWTRGLGCLNAKNINAAGELQHSCSSMLPIPIVMHTSFSECPRLIIWATRYREPPLSIDHARLGHVVEATGASRLLDALGMWHSVFVASVALLTQGDPPTLKLHSWLRAASTWSTGDADLMLEDHDTGTFAMLHGEDLLDYDPESRWQLLHELARELPLLLARCCTADQIVAALAEWDRTPRLDMQAQGASLCAVLIREEGLFIVNCGTCVASLLNPAGVAVFSTTPHNFDNEAELARVLAVPGTVLQRNILRAKAHHAQGISVTRGLGYWAYKSEATRVVLPTPDVSVFRRPEAGAAVLLQSRPLCGRFPRTVGKTQTAHNVACSASDPSAMLLRF